MSDPASLGPEILTEDEYKAAVKSGYKSGRRQNHALNMGGSVDIHTQAEPLRVLAVVRYVKITDAIRKEVAPLLTAATAKESQTPPARN